MIIVEKSNREISRLIDIIIHCGYKVHRALAPGFLESVYQKALAIELAKAGLNFQCEAPISVKYDGQIVGEFRADVFVENTIIVELKASSETTKAHEAQLVNYLVATGVDHGLLINFGTDIYSPRHKFRVYSPSKTKISEQE